MGKNEETESKKLELLDDTLEETEELIKIFVTSIKTAEKEFIRKDFMNDLRLNCLGWGFRI
jgi:hypothetical protein